MSDEQKQGATWNQAVAIMALLLFFFAFYFVTSATINGRLKDIKPCTQEQP